MLGHQRRRAARFVVALFMVGCDGTRSDEPADAGQVPDGGPGPDDAGRGEPDAATRPDGGADGGVKPDPFDTTVLTLAEGAEALPCTLSADRRKLLLAVKNDGSEATPAIPVAVGTMGTAHAVVVQTPELAPGASATLEYDRAPLAGHVGDWPFEVTVDPEALYGPARLPASGTCSDLRSRALAAMPVLYGWYDNPTGLFNGDFATGIGEWWTGANMVEVTIDHARETGDDRYFHVISRSFDQAAKSYPYADDNFLNEFYDDEGWWALAWIKAYDFTHEARYLEQAKVIFEDMAGGWRPDTCSGGLLWKKTEPYKSAISNALFLTVAARLHTRTEGDTEYLEWAEREWTWFSGSGMIQDDGQIRDGVNGETCEVTGPPYTYNQGVILGGLVELWRATADESLLDAAEKVADGALAHMTDENGVFVEAVCDANRSCDEGDGVQFKGVFTRNLGALYEVRPKESYRSFLIRQSDSLWHDARSDDNELGKYWQGPFDMADAKRQSTALDALVAAVRAANMNLALRSQASASAACSPGEAAERAIDGNAGPGSKWCSGSASATLTLDLGARREVVGFRVRHAGSGGESPAWNTRDFELEVSDDGAAFTRVVTVTDNTADVTTHLIPARQARHVRLHISNPQTAPDFVAARIYELEVFGSSL
jgi:predicted alpha-1,6-mannanase (GH76 family)